MKTDKLSRGISSSIATVLIATISITLVGTTYFFTSGILKERTAQTFEVIDIFDDKIIIRNTGTETIDRFQVLVDGKEVNNTLKEPIQPGKIGTIALNLTEVKLGRHELTLITKSMTQAFSLEIGYTIVTTIPVTEEKGILSQTESIQQGPAEVGKPVKWIKRVKAMNETLAKEMIPKDAKKITLKKIGGKALNVYEIEYETPAPYKKENIKLQQERFSGYSFQNIVGKSNRMQKVFESIQMVAKTDLTVLITGESGTGKDLTARAIHALSPRKKAPFISINCPTLPENILESELFGYRKGAFTNAVRDKKGLFQEADTGTIFLDEIGDISPTIQTKLLRVLQEKEIKPLGETKSIKVDVRIIASTNRILEDKIKNEEFREDFFYRLNVLPIRLPSLKDRREDIPLIAGHLLEKYSAKLKKPLKPLSRRAMEVFLYRTWKGNVREMENILIQGILYSAGDEIRIRDLGLSDEPAPVSMMENKFQNLPYKDAKEQTLQRFNGHRLKTARALGIGVRTLGMKLKRWQLQEQLQQC